MSVSLSDRRWWHELRNAVGSTNAALMVAEVELREHHVAAARGFVEDALVACAEAVALLQMDGAPNRWEAGNREVSKQEPKV